MKEIVYCLGYHRYCVDLFPLKIKEGSSLLYPSKILRLNLRLRNLRDVFQFLILKKKFFSKLLGFLDSVKSETFTAILYVGIMWARDMETIEFDTIPCLN